MNRGRFVGNTLYSSQVRPPSIQNKGAPTTNTAMLTKRKLIARCETFTRSSLHRESGKSFGECVNRPCHHNYSHRPRVSTRQLVVPKQVPWCAQADCMSIRCRSGGV